MGHNELSPAYWEQRYREQDVTWDVGESSAPLKAYVDQLQNKNSSILIPGAGNAYEAEYLFKAGFTNVYICDVAEAPLHNFLKRCPGFNRDHLLLRDFFELDRHFDLIIEQTFFCALHPSQRPAYFKKMAELLLPGSRLVGVLFNDALNADKPPFGGNKEEYLQYIQAVPFHIHTFEACYNSIKPRQGRELFMNLQKQ